jgi:DNA polymerase/3'-5' exonuclease PolX
MWLAGYALTKGYRLKYSTGLIKDEVAVAGETEESVFSALDLPWSEPQLREVINGNPIWLRNKP